MIKKITALCFLINSIGHANHITVVLHGTDDAKTNFGTLVFNDSPYGLVITPHLTQLPPGAHGFHLHEHPNCNAHGMAAGSHFDPKKANTHLGPYASGHLGDLPVLFVGTDGQANTPLLAPRLTSTELKGLTVMLHAGGDNYSDSPALGGGGARIACGVIQ
jgi:superoxide dismutase, Cu-Zn family